MQPNGYQLTQIAELVEAGKIKPIVDKEYPFSQMNEALQYVNTGRAKGKVVVQIAE
jgi:NADPH:quinone reductase-like Zn-dependent oxidoreductase